MVKYQNVFKYKCNYSKSMDIKNYGEGIVKNIEILLKDLTKNNYRRQGVFNQYYIPGLEYPLNVELEKRKKTEESVQINFKMEPIEKPFEFYDWLEKCRILLQKTDIKKATISIFSKMNRRKDFIYSYLNEHLKNIYRNIEEMIEDALTFSTVRVGVGGELRLLNFEKTECHEGYTTWLIFTPHSFNLKIATTKEAVLKCYVPAIEEILSVK